MENTFRLSEEDARYLVYDDLDGFELVSDNIIDNDRWSLTYEVIVKRLIDNTFWISSYSKGATEVQDHKPYEYDEPVFYRAEPKEVTRIEYVKIK